MIPVLVMVGLVGAHFAGDFLLQFSWMAMGKSKAWKPLLAHIGVYSACLVPFGILFAVVNGAAHLVTDFVTSRINAKAWEDKRIRAFWIGVGFDQFVHVAVLAGTYGVLS